MKKSDRFFTIAYTSDTSVIEVEVIETKMIDNVEYVHFQNVKYPTDRWLIPIDDVNKWKFSTQKEAENKLINLLKGEKNEKDT